MSTESMTSNFASMATLGLVDLFEAGKNEYERPQRRAEEATANMQAAAEAERKRAEEEAAKAAEEAERKRREDLKKRKGLSGTILTSGLGVTEEAQTRYKTLLGS